MPTRIDRPTLDRIKQSFPPRTIYLTRGGEPELHMVNGPFDYDRYKV